MHSLIEIYDPRVQKNQLSTEPASGFMSMAEGLKIYTEDSLLSDSVSLVISLLIQFRSDQIMVMSNLDIKSIQKAERLLETESLHKYGLIAFVPYSPMMVSRLTLLYEELRSHEEWFFCSFSNEMRMNIEEYMSRTKFDQADFMKRSDLFEFIYCSPLVRR
jgi:hypothetical protein